MHALNDGRTEKRDRLSPRPGPLARRLGPALRWLLPAGLLIALLGCFDSSILVKVKKDGSGTVEETVILSKAFTELMASFGAGMGGEEQQEQQDQDLVDQDKLRAKAAAMGDGVELVSADPVVTERGSGFKAVYRFKDINQLKVNENPSDNVPGPPSGEEQAPNPEELVQFRFTRGGTATLEIIYPKDFNDEEVQAGEEEMEAGPDPTADPEMMAMMKQLYADMRMKLVVEVDGTIVDTNATYREGSRVTLMEVDFGKLMEEGDKFDELMQAKPETVEEMKRALEGVESIKVETAQNIRIRFR
jgi:hypothetical protein